MKDASEFLNNLKEDSQLACELEKYLADIGDESEDALIEATCRFAHEKGYELKPDDIAGGKEKPVEIGDDELELVNGGGFLSRLTTGVKKFILNVLEIPVIKI